MHGCLPGLQRRRKDDLLDVMQAQRRAVGLSRHQELAASAGLQGLAVTSRSRQHVPDVGFGWVGLPDFGVLTEQGAWHCHLRKSPALCRSIERGLSSFQPFQAVGSCFDNASAFHFVPRRVDFFCAGVIDGGAASLRAAVSRFLICGTSRARTARKEPGQGSK